MENIKLIPITSSQYPISLLSLKEPPNIIFALGNLQLLNTFSVGIVGARACTKESMMLTQELVNQLSKNKTTILSGLAYGIDQVAHETCLECNAKTIAIIGSGFNAVKNRKTFSKILEHDGLILSEYFPDTPAYRANFPRRNTIIVALSKAIIAVETHLESGTMITAQEALKQNVPLFTFPGGIHDSKYLGNNLLLTKGAICINSSSDLIKRLRKLYPSQKFKSITNRKKQKQIPEQFYKLYSLLNNEPLNINEISKKSNLPLHEVQSKLTLMELEELIYKMPNNTYAKK